MHGSYVRWVCLAGLALLGDGCNAHPDRLPVYPVRGKVLYQGQPAAGAYVSFHPADPDAKLPVGPRAVVGGDGSFVLSTYVKEDGAPAGDYVVTVEWRKPVRRPDGETEPGPNLLPPRYQTPKTSGLRATVSARSENELPPFQLTR
jgi:hypothetical protein